MQKEVVNADNMNEVAWETGYEHAASGRAPYSKLALYEPLAASVGADLRASFDDGFASYARKNPRRPVARRNGTRRRALRQNGTRAALIAHMTSHGYSQQEAERIAPKSARQDSTRRALTPDELRRFRVVAEKLADPAIRCILLLLPLTGMRVAEACSLRLSAVQQGGKRGKLRAEVLGKAKGGISTKGWTDGSSRPARRDANGQISPNSRGPRGERVVVKAGGARQVVDAQGKPLKAPPQLRTVPLGSHGTRLVREYVEKYREKSRQSSASRDCVFVGPHGGKITTAMVQRACKAVVQKAGLQSGISPHWLRHSFVSQAIAKCWDPQRVREIIGHGKKDEQGRSLGGRLPAVTLLYIDDKALNNPGGNRRR